MLMAKYRDHNAAINLLPGDIANVEQKTARNRNCATRDE